MSQSILFTNNEKDSAEYRTMIQKTVDAIVDSVKDDRAYAGPQPLDLGKEISSYDILPTKGLGFDAMLDNVKKSILPNFLRTFSSDYMAHLHSAALQESLSAELILSTFNQSMDSWDQSPVGTETEVAVVRFLTKLFGYEAGDGCFTSGGSQSNLTGVLLARDWYCNAKLSHDVKKLGLPASYHKFRLYSSCISHFSMEKSCHLLGLGYDAVVKVPVRKDQTMDTDALRALIEKDVAAGNIPFCVVATIGTTDYGSIDDVKEITEIAKKYSMWVHADAAYGSGLVMSDKYRSRMGDLSLCDSITVDFHKMFLLPISCSAVLIRDAADFEPLELHADYLNREEDEEDGYTNLVGKSLQTTRRFDALKVWMTFQCRGRDGYGRIIDTCVENAMYVYEKLRQDKGFEVVTVPQISSVVFRVVRDNLDDNATDEFNKRVRRTLIHREGIVIGQTVFDGHTCLKFTLLNPELTHERLDSLLALIARIADEQ